METFDTDQGYDEDSESYVFCLNKTGLLSFSRFSLADIDRILSISDDLRNWLEHHKVEHTLHLQPMLSSKPSFIEIKESADAMLFKLTWL